MVWLLSSLSFFFFYYMFFILNNIFFILITLFYFIFLSFFPSFFFLPFLVSHVADRVLVLRLGVRPESLRWESRVQDIGPPETSQRHVISNSKSSQRSPSQHEDPAPLNDQQATVQDTLCQTTSKTGTQPHPLAERLPEIIISSQTPQNTPPDMVLPTRKTRSSLIHQNTGTSPLHQEAYTTH